MAREKNCRILRECQSDGWRIHHAVYTPRRGIRARGKTINNEYYGGGGWTRFRFFLSLRPRVTHVPTRDLDRVTRKSEFDTALCRDNVPSTPRRRDRLSAVARVFATIDYDYITRTDAVAATDRVHANPRIGLRD